MAAVRDNLCLIVDLDGFFVDRRFQTRELGYYSWMGDCGVYFFDVTTPYRKLNKRDRATVSHVSKVITGLPYRPSEGERPVLHPRALKGVIQKLYKEFRTEFRNVVGYKGGRYEKELLMSCNIPHFNIEQWGCPKYDDLPHSEETGCGNHKDVSLHHCAKSECETFWNWTRTFLAEQS